MKSIQSIEHLEAIMEQEKHDLVDELFQDAWVEAVNEGIEPSVIAKGAACSAFRQVVNALGAEEAQKIANDIPLMIESGQFVKEFKFN